MRKQYLFAGMLAVLCLLSVLLMPVDAQAAEVASGYCGADGDVLTWVLDDSGTLTISGTGKMRNGGTSPSSGYAPWYAYQEDIKFVVIEDGVTNISAYAFWGCESLVNVSIGSAVTTIGQCAFSDCSSLASINIPNNVTSIGNAAFMSCKNLTEAVIGNGVSTIAGQAFRGCSSLSSILIPDNVTSIGYDAFVWCTSLAEVKLSQNIYSIEEGVFCNCSSLASIDIPSGVTNIGESAFGQCTKLNQVSLPNQLETIGKSAFSGCSSLQNVVLPNGLSKIGDKAFSECDSLTSIDIPASVSALGSEAFAYCSGLKSVTIGEGVTSIGACAFVGCSSLTDVTIGKNVTSIGDFSFYGCGITSITIPERVTSIGKMTFQKCNNLKQITFLGDAPTFGEDPFSGVTATAYYPANNATWTADVMQNYGGEITWVINCTHEWVDATCAAPKTCSKCGSTEGSALEHTYESVVTAPTCTEQGYTTHTCSACGHSYKDSYVAEKGHAWGEWYTVDEASCTAEGLEQRDCDVCDSFETNTLPIKEHTYESVVTAPTCTEQGYTTHTCSACGDSYKDSYVAENGHAWGEWYTVDEASCTAEGLEQRDCDVCDSFETNILPIKDHSYESVVTAPTCTEQGYTTHTCTACGDSYQDSEVPANGHTEVIDEGVAATCTGSGLTEGSHCAVCQSVLVAQETIPAKGHKDEAADYVCDVCGGKLCKDHTQQTIAATAATCEKNGLTEGTVCTTCGEVLKAQEVIPATGHAWQEATCEAARHCTACGKTEGTALGHSYGEWTQVTAPTVEAPGLSERTCATCGGKEQKQLDQLEPPATEPTQPTEPSDQPEVTEPTQIAPTVPQGNDDRDGGNGNVILLIVLSALGGAALMLLLVLLVLKKKKDQEDEMQ